MYRIFTSKNPSSNLVKFRIGFLLLFPKQFANFFFWFCFDGKLLVKLYKYLTFAITHFSQFFKTRCALFNRIKYLQTESSGKRMHTIKNMMH